VRDAVLDVPKGEDYEIDFTTNARPDDIERLMKPLCSTMWEQGRAFGTLGGLLRTSGIKVEITTFRSEAYVDHSRKPSVEWGDSLEADLSRRDFTINALALDVVALDAATPDVQTLFDFYDGFNDLHEKVLRTRSTPRSSSATTRCACFVPRASPRASASPSIPPSRPRPPRWAID